GLAQDEYLELRYINEVRTHLQMARTLLKLAEPQREDAIAGLLSAQTQFDLYAAPPGSDTSAPSPTTRERSPLSFIPFLGQGGEGAASQSYQSQKAAVRAGLDQALAQLRDADAHARDRAAARKNADNAVPAARAGWTTSTSFFRDSIEA